MNKTAFLDLGGVLDIDFSGTNSWEEMLAEIGATGDKREVFLEIWDEIGDRVDIDFDIDDLIPILNSRGFDIPPSYSLLSDGFIKRFHKNPEITKLLDGLQKSGFDLAMITNMYPRMFDEITQADILPKGYEFKTIIESTVEKLKKPDPQIFKLALSRAQTQPENAIFIDNTEKNILAAESVGIRSFLYDFRDKDSISNILKAL